MSRLRNSARTRARKKAGQPMEVGILKGVHTLRHTFGRRLGGAGVPLETRNAVSGHAGGDITTHYSAAELSEFLKAAEVCARRDKTNSPRLPLASRKAGKSVGKRQRVSR